MNIFEEVKKLNLPANAYVVFGSGPLMAHGIRESDDIDIVTTQETYDRLKAEEGWEEKQLGEGWVALTKEPFEIGTKWLFDGYNPTLEYLKESEEIIEDVPFVNLEEVKEWKGVFGREKDLRDVKLIEEFLKKIDKNNDEKISR